MCCLPGVSGPCWPLTLSDALTGSQATEQEALDFVEGDGLAKNGNVRRESALDYFFTVDGIRVEVLDVDGFAIERIELRVDPEALEGLGDDADDDEPQRKDER